MKKILFVGLLIGLLFPNYLLSQTNYALTFSSATSNYVRVPYNAALQPTGAITLEAWLNVNSWTGIPGIVGNTEFGGYEFDIETVGGVPQIHFWVKRNGNYADVYFSQTTFGTGWHHVAGTFDGRYAKIYLDGVLKATNDAGAVYPIQYTYQNSLIIGAEAGSGADPYGNYYNGSVDEVRIWNIARPIDSIQAAMNRQLIGNEIGLAGYWKFDEGASTTSYDATSNLNNGTLVSDPEWILFDGGKTWYTLGATGFSDGQATSVSMAIASDGTPYVGYCDGANGSKATVMKYNGANWVAVGIKAFSSGVASEINFTLASDGSPYVVFKDGANGSKATVMKFNGTSWIVVGTAGFSAGSVTDIKISIKSDGTPYVGFADGANGGKPTAMYYNGSTWNIVGTAGITAGAPNKTNFTLSNDGTPFFAVQYNNGAGGQRASVLSFDGTSWNYVGAQGFSTNSAYYIRILFSPSNVPYVAFVDLTTRLTVMKYNSGTWENVGTYLSSVYTSATLPSLAFASDGTLYVAYLQGAYMAVKKYDGISWQFVGTAVITNNNSDLPCIAINNSGIPFEVHTENSLSGKVTLRRYLLDSNTPLPVELTSFAANAINNIVELKWFTATELNNYGFEIERATAYKGNLNEWVKVGFVHGSGNSNSPKDYSFTDYEPYVGQSYYRLKMIDIDGTFEYTNEIEVNRQLPSKFFLNQNYPNPFNPETVISYLLPVDGLVTLKVYDVLGKEVGTIVNEVKVAGNHQVMFNASTLSSGVYLYKLQSGNFIQTKKMLLIK